MAADFGAVLDAGDEGAAFWVGGIAVAVGAAVYCLYPGRGEGFENAEYLALGALVPALAGALALGRWKEASSRRARTCLAALFAAFFTFYLTGVLKRFEWEAWAGAALIAGWIRRDSRSDKPAAAAFLAAGLGFTCSFRLFWGNGGWRAFAAHEPLVWILLPGFTALGLTAFLSGGRNAARAKPGLWDAPALVLFALSATRVATDAEGFFTGTVALLRQGARVLWDAPSQYGFLDMTVAALVPASSAWQALYRLNSLLLFLSALAVYALLRATTRGRSGIVFSALAAWTAVLLVPGNVTILSGPNDNPSVGAFRFLWCYVLLAWATAFFMRRRNARPLALRELAPGVVFWTLGCLWSAESAAFSCAAAWPVFGLAAYELARARRFKEAAAAVASPPAALAAAAAAIEAYYRLRLGHGPDWRGFVEYALAFHGGYGALPIRPFGAVAVLSWAGILIVALAAVAFRRSPASKWLIVPAFATFWATACYFVSRSHDNTVLNLAPIWASALALSFLAVDESRPAVRVLRAGALPLLVGLLLAGLSNPANLRRYGASLLASRAPAELDRSIPPLAPEVGTLFDRAGVRADDGVAAFVPSLIVRPVGPRGTPALARPWLPVAPAVELGILDAERQRLYIRRFLDREGPAAAEGWILEPKVFDRPEFRTEAVVVMGDDRILNPRASGLFAELLRDHRVDRVVESENWRLTHFSGLPR